MFADTIVRPVSGLTSALRSMRENRLPVSPIGHSGFGIHRHSFTVAGAVPGLVLDILKTHTGFPFHLLRNSVDTENTAKHLTTSRMMLTADTQIGK